MTADPLGYGGQPGLPDPVRPLRPLTQAQQACWALTRLAPGSGAENLGIAFRTRHALRPRPLTAAANHLLRRHPALRLRFPEAGGSPVQHMTGPDQARITVRVRHGPGETRQADLGRFTWAPFDLAREFPLRVGYFAPPGAGGVVCLVVHRMVCDRASCLLLARELCQAYDQLAAGRDVPASLRDEVPMAEDAPPAPDAIRYWADHLRDARPGQLPLDGARPEPPRPTFAAAACRWPLSPEGLNSLWKLQQDFRAGQDVVLLGAFCLALLRHGAGPDLVVGVPPVLRPAGRTQRVGPGPATMAVRVRADPGAGFRELVARTRDAQAGGLAHGAVPAETVVPETGRAPAALTAPACRHRYEYERQPIPADAMTIGGDQAELIELGDRSRFDVSLAAAPRPDGVLLTATYRTEVHDEPEIAAFCRRLDHLLQQAASSPERPVRRLDLPGPADLALRDVMNRTQRRWPGPATALERVAQRAAATPDAPAVISGSMTVTYGQLLARAAAVRERLHAEGVRAGDVVGLALDRGPALAAAVLGVWAAEAAYLPLDIRQPDRRLAFQLDDADVKLVLAAEHAPAAWAAGHPVLPLGGTVRPAAEWAGFPAPDPGSAAYVIYTSGSTGVPKGVAVSHRGLANVVSDFAARLRMDERRPVLWSTTPAFDISALELLLPLCCGGQLVVAGDVARTGARPFLDLITAHDVCVVQATPTAWRFIVPEVTGELAGRQVLCGGEPLPAELARRLLKTGCRLANVYGPTETTIWSTMAGIETGPADPVPVGRPVANTRVFILDRFGQEAPPGVSGELCIAGTGVSLGYLNRPELNHERFGRHPLFGRYYRTGDIARLRWDGDLEILGRRDRQVKLRGYRIELGEIEAALHEHPQVSNVAVTVSGDPQTEEGELRAFVQARPPEAADLACALRQLAAARLPRYAVPGRIVIVDAIPETPNGKTDYRALGQLANGAQPCR
jgi:amino acid adenylation domain-containing protein